MPEAAGLWYEWHGLDEGEPLILSPGLGGSASYWKPNLAALGSRHRLLLYDHRGTGHSELVLGEVSVESMAADLIALMDALGIGRASLIGHAAGAVIGLAMALTHPARLGRLVAVNGWARPDPHFARCFDMRLELLRKSGAAAYVRAQPIFLYPAPWSSEHAEQLAADEAVHLAPFPPAENVEKRIAALRAFDIEARLGDISAPVLALAAIDDILVPAPCSQILADGIPGARLATMVWGGHACNVTDPDTFNKLALEFLRD